MFKDRSLQGIKKYIALEELSSIDVSYILTILLLIITAYQCSGNVMQG